MTGEEFNDFQKSEEKYHELEIFKLMKDSENIYLYCPNEKCNHFLTFLLPEANHKTFFCDYCCESICLDCKSKKENCQIVEDQKIADSIVSKCMKHKICFEIKDKNNSIKCENCGIFRCGICKMIIIENNYVNHEH